MRQVFSADQNSSHNTIEETEKNNSFTEDDEEPLLGGAGYPADRQQPSMFRARWQGLLTTCQSMAMERISQFKTSEQRPTRWEPIDSMDHSFNASIEGLRGIAASMTMISHILPGPEPFVIVVGMMGVTIFFVLSGFLITAVLIRLMAKRKSLYGHLVRFYADRFFRLGPALFLMISLTYWLHSRAGSNMAWIRSSAFYALFYLTNVRSLHPTWRWSAWDQTWTLACEEQFYIFWSLLLPFIVARSARGRHIIFACTLGTLVFVRIWISMFPGSFFGIDWHFGLWANMWKMILGSSVRLINIPDWLLQRRFAYIGLLSLAAILSIARYTRELSFSAFPVGWQQGHAGTMTWTDFCSGISTLVLLCGLHGPQGGIAILETQTLRFLGRVSYSWYLWQYPILLLHGRIGGYINYSDTAVALVVASCSTFWMEEPILRVYRRWKRRFDEGRLPA